MTARHATFARCLRAEALKLRRTLAVALAVLLPAAPPLLFLVHVLQKGSDSVPEGVSAMAWTFQGGLSLWCIFLLPPFAAMESSLVAGIEHQHRGWKHLLALPVRRGAVYAAKLVAAAALVAMGTASLCVYTLLSLWGLTRLRPEAGFVGPLPVWEILAVVALVGAASLLLLSVHAFVALRWPSFSLNIALALAALLGNAVLTDSRLRWLYPWSLPSSVQNVAVPLVFGWGTRGTPASLALAVALALAGGAVVSSLGVRTLSRRDVP
jgi:hypothetical protein